MPKPFNVNVPSFAGGLNEGQPAANIAENELSAVVNFLPAQGSLVKVKERLQNLFAVSGTDDRIVNYAVFTPELDLIEKVHCHYQNYWKADGTTETVAVQAAGTNYELWFGFYLEEPVTITPEQPLCVALFVKETGVYDSAKFRVTAQLMNSSGSALSGVNLVRFNENPGNSLPGLGYKRVVFPMTVSSGAKLLPAGEYFFELTGTGNDAAVGYEFPYVASPAVTRGFVVMGGTNGSGGTLRYPFDFIVYQPPASIGTGTVMRPDTALMGAYFDGPGWASGPDIVDSLYAFGSSSGYRLSPHTTLANEWDGIELHTLESNYPKTVAGIRDVCIFDGVAIVGGANGVGSVESTSTARGSFDLQDSRDTSLSRAPAIGAVYPPLVNSIWVGNINPGRLYCAYGNTLRWSGSTTDASDYTTWEAGAIVDFGDLTETIRRGRFFASRQLLFTESGRLYVLSGEPPLDPAVALGTLSAELIGLYGRITTSCEGGGFFWFSTENGSQVWRMGPGLGPERVDGKLRDLQVYEMFWDDTLQQLWMYSRCHVKAAYNATPADDSTAVEVVEPGRSIVWDAESGAFTTVVLSSYQQSDPDNEGGGHMGPHHIDLKTTYAAWTYTVESSYVSIGTWSPTYTETDPIPLNSEATADVGSIVSATTPPFYVQDTTAHELAPVNSTDQGESLTAYIITREYRVDDLAQAVGVLGQVRDVILDAYLPDATTVTLSVLDSENNATSLGTLTGGTADYTQVLYKAFRRPVGAVPRMSAFRVKVSITGIGKERLRALRMVCHAVGKVRVG